MYHARRTLRLSNHNVYIKDNAMSMAKTPAYRLRANRVHSKLKTLCHQWMRTHRPEVVEKLHRQARKEVVRG